MKKIILIVSLFILVVWVQSQTLLDTALNFTAKDVYGNTYVLFDILQENKIVVIDFFSTS